MTLGGKIKKILGKVYKSPRPSLNDLDKKLERYLDFEKGFFIEAGANDGYSQSNTYYLEKKKNWRGLLVEGIPDLYEECRNQRPNCIVKNCALVAYDYDQETVAMHYAHLMSVVDGSMKDEQQQKEHIDSGLAVQRIEDTYKIEVPARTLDSLLEEIDDLPVIDFFSLDVEGYELQVLKGLNLKKYRPRFILVEARFFDEVNDYLQDAGYEMIEQLTGHDYLYRFKESD